MNNFKNITGVKTDRPWKLSHGVGKDTEKEKYYQQISRLRNMRDLIMFVSRREDQIRKNWPISWKAFHKELRSSWMEKEVDN